MPDVPSAAPTRRAVLDPSDQQLVRQAAEALLAELDAVADEVSRRVLERHPALVPADDPAAADALRRSSASNVGAFLSTLAFGVAADSVDPPDGALDLIDRVACDPDGLPVLLRAYRLGAAETWQLLAPRLGAGTTDVDTLTRLVLTCSAQLNAYTDHVAECIAERWSEISREMSRSGRRREEALRALLRGDEPDPDSLDHPLERFHVAVAAHATEGHPPAALRHALGDIRGRFAGAAAIELEEADGVHRLWLSARTRPSPEHLDRLVQSPPAGIHLAVSDAAFGRDGFLAVTCAARDTLHALRRLRPDGGAATYRQLALASTLLADPERALRFAEAVLGPLAERTSDAERLRQTLRAYFACSESKAATGVRLGIHEKTVAYRLRRAADLLQAPVEDLRAELEAALLVLDAAD